MFVPPGQQLSYFEYITRRSHKSMHLRRGILRMVTNPVLVVGFRTLLNHGRPASPPFLTLKGARIFHCV